MCNEAQTGALRVRVLFADGHTDEGVPEFAKASQTLLDDTGPLDSLRVGAIEHKLHDVVEVTLVRPSGL